MNTTHAFVFARGGSKGLPRKNILPIGGLPLLAHGIELAKEMNIIDRIFVSTDCQEIAAIGESHGAELIDRPADLASDAASEWLAWQHAIRVVQERYGPFGCFLSLPATAPLRIRKDVESCLGAMQQGVDVVVTMSPSNRSPWFNMVKSNSNGFLNLLASDQAVIRRQDAPSCFDLTTVAYAANPEFVLQANNMWQGNVVGVEIPLERSIDIDTPLDFAIAKFLMEQWKHSSLE